MTRGRTAEGRHAEHAQTERSKHLTHQTDVCLKDAQVVVGLEVSRVGLDGSLGVTDGCRRQSLHGIDHSQITHTLGAAPSVLDPSFEVSRPGEVDLLDKGIVETLNRLLVCAYILVLDAEVVVDYGETRVVTNRCFSLT